MFPIIGFQIGTNKFKRQENQTSDDISSIILTNHHVKHMINNVALHINNELSVGRNNCVKRS